MTLHETTALLTPLALAMRVELDRPTFQAYAAMLATVPAHLAVAGVEELRLTGLRFFPTAMEIQAAAERARRQQLAMHPWSPCAECEDAPGWRSITDHCGDQRLERCPCRARHQQVLTDHGLLEAIAVLPTEVGAGDERVYPTLEQLPAKLQKQLKTAAAQKVLK